MGGGPAAGATAGETHEASCVEGCKLALVAKYTRVFQILFYFKCLCKIILSLKSLSHQ